MNTKNVQLQNKRIAVKWDKVAIAEKIKTYNGELQDYIQLFLKIHNLTENAYDNNKQRCCRLHLETDGTLWIRYADTKECIGQFDYQHENFLEIEDKLLERFARK